MVKCTIPAAKESNLFATEFDQTHHDYEELTPLDWVEYEFATIEYDYQIHPEAARRIRALFEQLHDD